MPYGKNTLFFLKYSSLAILVFSNNKQEILIHNPQSGHLSCMILNGKCIRKLHEYQKIKKGKVLINV